MRRLAIALSISPMLPRKNSHPWLGSFAASLRRRVGLSWHEALDTPAHQHHSSASMACRSSDTSSHGVAARTELIRSMVEAGAISRSAGNVPSVAAPAAKPAASDANSAPVNLMVVLSMLILPCKALTVARFPGWRKTAIALSLLPTLAFAQQQDPPNITLQTQLVRGVITYLQMGGTHNEGALLAQQVIDAAQQQVRAEAQDKALADAKKTVPPVTASPKQ